MIGIPRSPINLITNIPSSFYINVSRKWVNLSPYPLKNYQWTIFGTLCWPSSQAENRLRIRHFHFFHEITAVLWIESRTLQMRPLADDCETHWGWASNCLMCYPLRPIQRYYFFLAKWTKKINNKRLSSKIAIGDSYWLILHDLSWPGLNSVLLAKQTQT